MDVIKKFVSRKLLTFILAPVLSAMLIAVNGIFGNVIPDDAIQSIVMKIIEAAMVLIGGQSIVDATAALKNGGK